MVRHLTVLSLVLGSRARLATGVMGRRCVALLCVDSVGARAWQGRVASGGCGLGRYISQTVTGAQVRSRFGALTRFERRSSFSIK